MFGTTGGRAELGVFPSWDTRYLFTFQAETEEISRANAGVSAYVPIHYRESSTGRTYHASLPTLDAYGRMVSIDARPGFCSRLATMSLAKDAAVNVGPVSNGGWDPDVAHQGSFTYVAYLTTGDPYFLEEMYAWATWNLAYSNPGTCGWCRGGDPTKGVSWGFVNPSSNTRAYGWVLRNLAHTALLAPDGSPEKAYYTDKFLNNIAVLEGRFGLDGGLVTYDPSRRPMYQHGREVLAPNVPNPLRIWEFPVHTNYTAGTGLLPDKTYHMVAPWMHNIIFVNLGHIEELGFPVTTLRRDVMKNLLGQLKDPNYTPYLMDAYYTASAGVPSVYYGTWQQVREAFEPIIANRSSWAHSYIDYVDFAYSYIAIAAASYLSDVEWNGAAGDTAWDWLRQNFPRNSTALASNPKWAIVPRATVTPGSLADPNSWAPRFKRVLHDAAPTAIPVTITTYPVGLTIVVDGIAATAPQTYNWVPGSSHTLSAPASQGNAQTRHIFMSWSNGGSQTQAFTASPDMTNLVASFKTQHALVLAASPVNGGTIDVLPTAKDGFYDAGTTITVTTKGIKSYKFVGFSGNLTGTQNPQSLLISGPSSVVANFSKPGNSGK